MANTRTAQKQVRASRRKQMRNKPVRSRCKTRITKAEKLIFSDELKSAEKAVVAAISALDRAAEKEVIHPNNAARRKSRLMQKLNSARAQASARSESQGAPLQA